MGLDLNTSLNLTAPVTLGLIFALFGLIVIYALIYIPLRNIYKLNGIPSPKGIPIFGNALEMLEAQYEFNKVFDRWSALCGDRLVVWITYWFPMVVLGNARDAKKILSNKEHVQKGFFYHAFDPAIGTGAFNSPVGIWKQRRPHLERAFHSKVLQKLPSIFDRCAKRLVEALEEDGLGGTGKGFDVHPYLNLSAIQMIIEGAWGIKIDPLGERNSKYWQKCVDSYNRGTYLAEYRMLRPWYLMFDFLWELTPSAKELSQVLEWSKENLFARMAALRKEIITNEDANGNEISFDKEHPNFMDLLLSKKELGLSHQDLLDEMSSVYIAGHDATGKSLAFTLLYLGFYPSAQDLVAAELSSVFGSNPEPSFEIKEEDLGKLKYLEACIKESLRLMPPVSFITRRVGSDVVLDSNAVIPKGTEVAIATYLVHRDPETYPEPEVFKPERFLAENSKGRDPYAWIPFSAGPRNCLGPKFAMMESKIVLANLLLKYKVQSLGSMTDWVLNTNVTLKLENGWNIQFWPRNGQKLTRKGSACG